MYTLICFKFLCYSSFVTSRLKAVTHILSMRQSNNTDSIVETDNSKAVIWQLLVRMILREAIK